MKIEIKSIPAEGLSLEEKIKSIDLDLDTELIKFIEPVSVEAKVYKISNVVTAELKITSKIQSICSRCLSEFTELIRKEVVFNYKIEPNQTHIELDPDIREELILDYPIKPLCKPDCKGLCQFCGKDLNLGDCGCKRR